MLPAGYLGRVICISRYIDLSTQTCKDAEDLTGHHAVKQSIPPTLVLGAKSHCGQVAPVTGALSQEVLTVVSWADEKSSYKKLWCLIFDSTAQLA